MNTARRADAAQRADTAPSGTGPSGPSTSAQQAGATCPLQVRRQARQAGKASYEKSRPSTTCRHSTLGKLHMIDQSVSDAPS